MKKHDEAFSVYLIVYRKERTWALGHKGSVAGAYSETVRTTWKRSFKAVAEVSPTSIDLLRLSAFLAPAAIPYELIPEAASELGEPLAPAGASPQEVDHALNLL